MSTYLLGEPPKKPDPLVHYLIFRIRIMIVLDLCHQHSHKRFMTKNSLSVSFIAPRESPNVNHSCNDREQYFSHIFEASTLVHRKYTRRKETCSIITWSARLRITLLLTSYEQMMLLSMAIFRTMRTLFFTSSLKLMIGSSFRGKSRKARNEFFTEKNSCVLWVRHAAKS